MRTNQPPDKPKVIDPRFEKFVNSIVPANIYSQFGEDSIIKAIFNVVGASNKWALEVGAHNGIFMSNTRRLIIDEDWGAVLIEADDQQFHHLEQLYADNERVFTVNRFIDSVNTLDSIIDIIGVHPGMDLMVIDIDGQDYWTLMDLQATPRVLMVEFDPNPKNDEFIPGRDGEGQAGRSAIIELVKHKGYVPICSTLVNCVAVRGDLLEKFERWLTQE